MIKLEGRDLFYRILLLVLNPDTLVDQRKLASAYLFSNFISGLNRLALIKLQKLHPIFQDILILEEKLLLLIVLIPVTNLDPKASISLENALDSKTLQADNFEWMLGTTGLADCHDGMMKEQLDIN